MDARYIGAAVGFIMGSVGYMLSKFWILPIMKFKKTRGRVLKLMLRVEADLDSGMIQKDRAAELRQINAVLSERYGRLHPAYRTFLVNKGELVDEACRHLSTLTNTRNADHARMHISKIRHYLGK